jgi:soluble lytic murein transglycosylase-like protein
MNAVQRAIFPAILIGCAVVTAIGLTCGAARNLLKNASAAPAVATVQAAVRGIQTAETQAEVGAGCIWAGAYPQSVRRWCGLIEQAAGQTGLERGLLAALMLEESGGDPLAASRDGAVGLLQVMPRDGTAERFQCIYGPCFAARPSITQLQDPEFNLTYGATYLARLVQQEGSLREALRAYGPMGTGYAYADAVLAIQARYTGN